MRFSACLPSLFLLNFDGGEQLAGGDAKMVLDAEEHFTGYTRGENSSFNIIKCSYAYAKNVSHFPFG